MKFCDLSERFEIVSKRLFRKGYNLNWQIQSEWQLRTALSTETKLRNNCAIASPTCVADVLYLQ